MYVCACRPDGADQTCRNHRACGTKRPNGGQTQGRQSRPRASQKQAGSTRDAHKTPRLCTKISQKQANQSKAEAGHEQAKSKPEPNQNCKTTAPVHKNKPATKQAKQARSKAKQAKRRQETGGKSRNHRACAQKLARGRWGTNGTTGPTGQFRPEAGYQNIGVDSYKYGTAVASGCIDDREPRCESVVGR